MTGMMDLSSVMARIRWRTQQPALSYMIQNSRKPIVITGAQKPIEMDVTDAKTNLLDSFIYASDNNSQDVNIVFDRKSHCRNESKKRAGEKL